MMYQFPPLQTKFYIPPVPANLISRPRLIERMNEGLAGKLTLVSAPAGFGKTTLITEWVAGSARQVAWLSLDEGDNDPVRFVTYLITALQQVEASIGRDLQPLLQSPQMPAVQNLLAALVNEVNALQADFTLILEDYHLITAPPVHQLLRFLLKWQPPRMHLLLSTREDPPLLLPRLRARGQMTEVRQRDLRFTPEEAASFLNQAMGLSLPAQAVATLEARTEGWIAGLQMAALSMRGHQEVDSFIQAFGGQHRFILDYLVEEVLERQPAKVQDFLLRTAVLERMNAAVCAVLVSGQPPAADAMDEPACQRMLETLDRSNLFLVRLDDERRWFRYHHLFAELLRGRLHQTQPALLPALQRLASQWHEAQGLIDEAIQHALAGHDPQRAADLVEGHGMQMIVDSRVSQLASWLEALPGKLARERPWLCVLRAWARYYAGPREQAEQCLQDAEQSLQAKTQPNTRAAEHRHIAGHIAALRAYIALQNQDFEQIGAYARQALELLPEDDYARGTSAIALAETHRYTGDLAAMEAAYAKARQIAEAHGNLPMAVSATAYMAYQQAKQGRLQKAAETNQEALRLAAYPDGRRAPAAGLPLVKLGDVLRERNELDAAREHLEEGIRFCQLWGHSDALVGGYTHLARVHLAQGDLASASDCLGKAEVEIRRTAVDPWSLSWVDDCCLRLWLAENNLASAVRWAQGSGLGIDDRLNYVRDLEHVNLARVLVAQGFAQPGGEYLDQALRLLERLLAATQAAGWVSRTIEVLVLRAQALHAKGESRAALDALGHALALAEPAGYVSVFIDEGPPVEKLLHQAAQQGIHAAYAQSLLGAFELRHQLLNARGAPGVDAHPRGVGRRSSLEALSEREEQVLKLLATQLNVPQIADHLGVSVTTVRTHIRHIYEKLGVHNRYEALSKRKMLP